MREEDRALFEAKTAEDVKKAIANGADVNRFDRFDEREYNGLSALTYATSKGNIDVMQALIEAGADVNAQGLHGYTALMLAETTEQTKLLLEAGADVDKKLYLADYDALQFAKTAEQTKLLLEAGANPNTQASKYVECETPLMRCSSPEQAKLLLESGADPNIQDKRGCTALYHAKNAEITKVLLDAGANPNLGTNALFNTDDVKKAKLLLDAGIFLDSHVLFTVKSAELATFYINAGANPNIFDKRKNGWDCRPIHLAWSKDVVKALIDGGANINAPDISGDTFLDRIRPEHYTFLNNKEFTDEDVNEFKEVYGAKRGKEVRAEKEKRRAIEEKKEKLRETQSRVKKSIKSPTTSKEETPKPQKKNMSRANISGLAPKGYGIGD